MPVGCLSLRVLGSPCWLPSFPPCLARLPLPCVPCPLVPCPVSLEPVSRLLPVHPGAPPFFFSRDDVTELSTPRGGGQRKEPKLQEPSRPKPTLKQAPRARKGRDRTGQDLTKRGQGAPRQTGQAASKLKSKQASRHREHRELAEKKGVHKAPTKAQRAIRTRPT